MDNKEVNVILDRLQGLETDRARYHNIFSESAKYAWPAVQDMVKTVQDNATGADIRTVDIYDSTPRRGSHKMATGIFANMYPAGVRWFEISASDPELNENDEVRQWTSLATTRCLDEILRSNFQTEKIAKIRSKIVFGNGCITPKLSKDKKIVFQCYHISNVLFDVDADGEIDTVFRKLYYTARQCKQKWPKENLGKTIEQALKDNNNQKQRFEIIHAVFPREDYDSTKIIGKEGKKFVSMFINRADNHIIAEENGFDDMPYIIGRLDIIPDETTGVGLVGEMLPDIKMTNSMCRTFVESCEKQANPPLIMEDDGVVGQPDASPNGVIYIRSGAAEPKPLQTGTNSALNAEIIRQYKMDIEEGFYLSLFDVLRGLRNMTASEVVQRTNDSLTLMSAFVSSEQKDMDLIIARVMNLLIEAKRLPPPPVKGFEYDIAYKGRLSMAMSAVQANATEQFLAKWSPYGQIYPILDNFDLDKAAKGSAFAQGVPSEYIKNNDEVQKIREDRQQEEQAMKQASMMETASKAYKNTTGSAEPNSLAEMIGNGL